jgi:hypothetical protein
MTRPVDPYIGLLIVATVATCAALLIMRSVYQDSFYVLVGSLGQNNLVFTR